MMRLLKLDDRGEPSITRFLDEDEIPCYAILSHTWGPDEEEVTLKDVEHGSGKTKAGFNKIRFCNDQARRDGLQYIWVDTCCIDKSSSAELQEAVTSMFRWYRRASKCYVHMSDVDAGIVEPDDQLRPWEAAFRKSRWFTRGWTLQELLAPASVQFFSQDEKLLGNKKTLEQQIHETTGIPVAALRGAPLTDFGVDMRLQWAENRRTRRKEDRAYCLLGIFNVFMPLIYGEGENAFVRLKAEIDAKLKSGQPHSLPSPQPLPYSPFPGMDQPYSNGPQFTNPWSHQLSSFGTHSSNNYPPTGTARSQETFSRTQSPPEAGAASSQTVLPYSSLGPYYRQNYSPSLLQDPPHTSPYPSISYFPTFARRQQQQIASFEELDASRGSLTLSNSTFNEVQPRNIYDVRPVSKEQSGSYGVPTLRRSPSISSINSVHSEVAEHDSQGNVTKRTVTTTTTTYYSASCSSASESEYGRTLSQPPGPPAPRSIMGMFSSKMSSNTQKKHKCKVCDKRFTRPSSLQTHMYSHTGQKPFACDVEGCGRHFSVVSNLRRHKTVVHRIAPQATNPDSDSEV